MRITDSKTFRTFLYNYNRVKEALDRAQQEIGTGKKLLKPSDDPVNVARSIISRSNLSKIEQFNKNINFNIAYSKEVQLALSETEKIITNIKKETLRALNGTMNEDERKILAQFIMGNLDDLRDISNSKFLGKALFSGFETEKKAFSSIESSIVNIDPLPSMVLETSTVTTFKDLPELDRGIYNFTIDSDGTDVTISLTDEDGNVVQLDSNGINEYDSQNGNIMNDTLTVVNAAGKTINIGRGIEIELDTTLINGSQTFQLEYTEEQTAAYHGDAGELRSRISDDTIISLSVSGNKVFQNNRVISTTFIDNTNGISISDGNGDVSFTIGDGKLVSSTITLTQGTSYTQDQILTLLDDAGLYIGQNDNVANSINIKASFDKNGHLVLNFTNEAKADKIVIREYTNNKNTLENTLGIKTGTFKGQDLFDVITDIAEMINSDTFHAIIEAPTPWSGNSQSEVKIGGAYTGDSDNTYLFTVDAAGGIVGATNGLRITVTDQSSGNVVKVLEVGDTYEPETELEVVEGLYIKLTPYSLEANDTFTVSVRTDRDRLDRLDLALEQVLEQSVKVGYNLTRLNASSTRMDHLTLTMTEELSRIEDSDVAQAYINYKADEIVYNSLLQLHAKFQNLTLLNFI